MRYVLIPVFIVVCFLAPASSLANGKTVADTSQERSVLLMKTTDKKEVLPGGRIRFTIRVQNVLLRVINDAEVTERFDPSLLSVVESGSAVMLGSGSMQWALPRLDPGEVWEHEYVLAAHASVEHGTVLNTITTITGTDIADGPLQDQVSITAISVLSALPTAGVATDLLFLISSLPLAMTVAVLHAWRRKR